MNKLSHSKDEQIELLLARKLFAEIDKLYPNMASPWELLTITESDIHAYLETHPESAHAFFAQAGGGDSCPNWHDVPAVWKDVGAYKVAWVDHGKPVEATTHSKLEDALVKYIRLRYLGG